LHLKQIKLLKKIRSQLTENTRPPSKKILYNNQNLYNAQTKMIQNHKNHVPHQVLTITNKNGCVSNSVVSRKDNNI